MAAYPVGPQAEDNAILVLGMGEGVGAVDKGAGAAHGGEGAGWHLLHPPTAVHTPDEVHLRKRGGCGKENGL